MSRPYACNLAINKSRIKQSKAFKRSVNNARKASLLSAVPIQISSSSNEQC